MSNALIELVSMLSEFSLIVFCILLSRKWVLKVAGPLWTYRLWYIPIVYLALNVFVLYAPMQLPANQHALVLNTHTFVQKVLPVDEGSIYPTVVLSFWLTTSFIGFTAFLSEYWLSIRNLKVVRGIFETSMPGKHKVHTIYSDKITTPSTYGLFKSTLLLPSNFHIQFTPLQQELILEHELNHIRRKDSLINLVWLFCCCLFWFNPLSYFAWRTFRLDQELSCDFLTLQKRSNEEKATYGELIVAMSNRQSLASIYCGIHSSFNQTMERIVMLKKTLKSKASSLTGALLMCVYATGGLVLAQNNIVDEDSVRYIINNLDVLKHQNVGSHIIDLYEPFESGGDEDYLLGFWDENSPQRVAVKFDTERAVSGELLTTVSINSYKNHKNRETRTFIFVGEDVEHTIEFAENEMTDQPFKIDFQVQKIRTDPFVSEEQRKEQSIQQHKDNILKYTSD